MPTSNQDAQKKLMARAIELSIENVRSGGGGPFGAVIAKDGEIVAEAANCVTRVNDPTAHAEVMAIREACKKLRSFELKGYEIYASCEPCPMCVGAIYWSRLDRVHYAATATDAASAGFDDQFIYDEIKRLPSDRKISMNSIMRTEALAAFRAWRESCNKTPY